MKHVTKRQAESAAKAIGAAFGADPENNNLPKLHPAARQ